MPTVNFAPDVKRADASYYQVAGFVLKQLLHYRLVLIFVLAAALVAAMCETMGIALFVPFLESLGKGGQSSLGKQLTIGFMSRYMQDMDLISKIRLLAVLILVVEAVKAAARYVSGLLAQRLKINIDRALRLQCFNRLIQAGLSYLNKEQLAKIFTIINNFTGHTSTAIMTLIKIVPDMMVSLVAVAILFTISWKMTIVTMTVALFTSILVNGLVARAKRIGYHVKQAVFKLNHIGFELLNGLFLIRMFAREGDMKNKFGSAIEDLQKKSYTAGLLEAAVSPIAALLLILVVVILLLAATVIMDKQAEYWLEMLILFIVVFTRLGGPLSRVNQQRARFAGMVSSIYEVQNFIEQDDKHELVDGNLKFEKLKDRIDFKDVDFRYDSEEDLVLRKITLSFPEGRTTALVGGSGSGKTTIIALLARLYDPVSGKVTVDGVDLKEFDSSNWRRKIGVVSQNTFLFNDSVRNNIAFGKPDASQEEIERAARQANIHDYIVTMKDGYDTILGDRGVRLSGGQAQRVAIARAILIEPQILLLDEATSALDTISERQVQQAIDQVSRNRTVVVVAHRLSTVRNADKIVVMENGEVVEQGTHDKLLASKGKYWQYVELQNLYQKVDESGERYDDAGDKDEFLEQQTTTPDFPDIEKMF